MRRYDVQIELTFTGPLLTASSEPGDFGLDMIIARTDDCPYIPGTLLSGKLDQAWQEIEEAAPDLFRSNRAALLGERNQNKEPLRKQLFFSDLNLAEQGKDNLRFEAVQHRVTIDKERGAAAEQQLVAMESPVCPREKILSLQGRLFFSRLRGKARRLFDAWISACVGFPSWVLCGPSAMAGYSRQGLLKQGNSPWRKQGQQQN